MLTLDKDVNTFYALRIQAKWRDLMHIPNLHYNKVAATIDKYTYHLEGYGYNTIEDEFPENLWFETRECLYQDESSIKFKGNLMQIYVYKENWDGIWQEEWMCKISYKDLANLIGGTTIKRILTEGRIYRRLYEEHGPGYSTEICFLAQCFLSGEVSGTIQNPDVLDTFLTWLRLWRRLYLFDKLRRFVFVLGRLCLYFRHFYN